MGRRVGLGRQLDMRADALTLAGRKRLELARALATRPKLLLLDEVMAGLNPIEVEEIVGIVRAIKDAGVVILLIEHVMQAVVSLAERVYVLSNGRIIASGSPQRSPATRASSRPIWAMALLRASSRGVRMLEVRDVFAGYGVVQSPQGREPRRRSR